jgi:hypothetical protein
MSFTSGTKFGPYEILSAIGAGGMGEVYKARDTRLNRTVAIKVLPAHFSDNAEMKARFEREARTLASLNTIFAGNQNLRRKIFDILCATGFSSTVSLFRPLWGFHRPPAESLAGNPGIRRHNRFASCETNAVHALENC